MFPRLPVRLCSTLSISCAFALVPFAFTVDSPTPMFLPFLSSVVQLDVRGILTAHPILLLVGSSECPLLTNLQNDIQISGISLFRSFHTRQRMLFSRARVSPHMRNCHESYSPLLNSAVGMSPFLQLKLSHPLPSNSFVPDCDHMS